MTSIVLEKPIQLMTEILKESTPSERKKNNICIRIIQRKFKCLLLGLIILLILLQAINSIFSVIQPNSINLDIFKIKNNTY